MEETSSVVLPGEWEPQAAVWLGWEHRPELRGYHTAVFEIIRSIQGNVAIKIVVPNDSVAAAAQLLLHEQDIDLSSIQFLTIKDNRYWIRDHGPTFIRNEKGEQQVVDFAWSRHDNELSLVDVRAAEQEGLSIIKAPLVNEGGGLESNGKGTILLVESMMLDRNPDKTRQDIETIYQKAVGASKVIWLPRGLVNDPNGLRHITDNYYGYGVGGHVDEMVRFVNPRTLLIAWVDEEEKMNPVHRQNYEVLSEAYDILAAATDQDGNPFTILKIPMPDLIAKPMRVTEAGGLTDTSLDISLFEGDIRPTVGDTVNFVAAASYANFLITNGAVLLPTYIPAGSSLQKEEEVKRVFAQVFPERELVFIDCLYQNFRGGGIHCSTKQQPEAGIRIPVSNETQE